MRSHRILPRADWYFTRAFLVYFGLCAAALLALVVVADLFQRADEFFKYAQDNDVSSGVLIFTLLQYYGTQAPSLLIQEMLPLAMLLAGILTVTSACAANEYIVLRSSGVSMQRALLPILVPALLFGYLVQYGRDAFLPFLLRHSRAIADEVRPRGARPVGLRLRDDREIRSIAMGHFDSQGYAHNLRIESRDRGAFQTGGERSRAFEVFTARRAVLHPRLMEGVPPDDLRRICWKPLEGAQARRIGRWMRSKPEPWDTPLPTYVTPAMIERQILGDSVMTWDDLEQLVDSEEGVRLEMHRRRSEPWAILVVLMLGLAVVLHRSLGGRELSYAQNIAIATLLCAGFYILRAGFLSLKDLGQWYSPSPAMAAWLPVLLVAAPALWVYQRLER